MKKKIFIILIPIALGMIGWGVWATSNPHSWTNGLVGYWSFDGQYTTSTAGTRDVSNNGKWGAFNGGVKPVGGVSGQALDFDGTDDYVSVLDTTGSVLDITTAITISAWVKLTNVAGDGRQIVAKNTTGSGFNAPYHLNIDQTTGKTRGRIGDGVSASQDIVGSTNVADGSWHHVVFTYDSSNLYLYVDGKSDATPIAKTITPTTNNDALMIGSWNNIWQKFLGLLDEVRIYNRALSAGEVKQHYDQTRRNLKVNQPSGKPPVGWWKLDEGNGTTTNDSSVNKNNCTMYYMATSTNGSWTDGKIGKALSFDGDDDYVDCGSGISYAAFPGMTLEAWVKRSTVGSRDYIVSAGYAPYQFEIWNTNTVGVEIQIDSSYYNLVSSNTFTSTEWSHLVFTHTLSSGAWYIYVNGSVFASGTRTGTAYTGTNNTRIGNHIGAADGMFGGLIDDVRIYNYARTAEQITADYQAGAYRTIVGASVPSSWWTSGLVGYWSFDGQYTTSTAGTRDVSGNGNWGAFNGGVKPVGGVVGQALSFDGVDDYVNAGSGTSLDITSAITIEAWVYATSWPTVASTIYSRYTDAGGGVELRRDSSKISMLTTNAGVWYSASGVDSDTPLNKWLHIVGTFDGTNLRLYIDGVLKGGPTAGSIGSASANAVIGQRTNLSHPWNGPIDEVRIYNRALSADEVVQHYQQTRRNLGM